MQPTHADPTPTQLKLATIKLREQEVLDLGRQIDSMMSEAARKCDAGQGAGGAGCFAWLSKLFRRKDALRQGKVEDLTAALRCAGTASDQASSSAPVASKSLEVNSRIFGLAGAKKASDPAKMLEQAASVMRARIEQLEQRAAEQRSEAARLVRAGQKAQAMRALKKAKQLEGSVSANCASLDAVEQQVDLLAQAAVQQTLTSALETTSKSMKAKKNVVARAERAVDDVVEVRDMADDLNSAISELANHSSQDVDEDMLEEELEAMMQASEAEGQASAADEEDEAETTSVLGKKAGKSSSVILSKLPSVPKARSASVEKTALLEGATSSSSSAMGAA